ncbi:MAG: hypothetical protein A4E58_01105 [Syntrophorhabdus sp. PtaB.Bin006]|nr:MAG: hypothetical protein A4E58_01105 [Syntrophorhabdus sp. PtaB.Bin006]
MLQIEMDFDGLRGAKVPPPGGVPRLYIEDRVVPQATKQGAKDVRPVLPWARNDHPLSGGTTPPPTARKGTSNQLPFVREADCQYLCNGRLSAATMVYFT